MGMPVEAIRRFRTLRALVIGDAMLDTYLEGTAARLCNEGPVPVVRKTAEQRVPGGAANVAANLRALGAEAIFLGMVGRDAAGHSLRAALRERGVDDAWLVEDHRGATLHKMRILADGQYVVRFDDEIVAPHSRAAQHELLRRLEEVWPRCDVVIIPDYAYGVASDAVIAALRRLRQDRPIPYLVDSKDLYRFRRAGATVVKPNHLEARLLVEHGRAAEQPDANAAISPSEIERIGRLVLALLDSEYAAITCAAAGVFVCARDAPPLHVPAHPVAHPYDVGAGDTFTAALGLALAACVPMDEAARIAVDAAGIAVAKRGTAVVTHRELLQRVSLRTQAPHGLGQGRHALIRLQAQLEDARRRGRTIVFTNGVFDILHAGHVQFLRQAKTLGDVLVVGVNSDASARRLKGPGRPINPEQDRLALVEALDPVDHAILFDEDTPEALIRALRPDFHVKGGDYAEEELPEAQAVRDCGGRVVILPLAGSVSTSALIDRILSLAVPPNVNTMPDDGITVLPDASARRGGPLWPPPGMGPAQGTAPTEAALPLSITQNGEEVGG